MIILTFRSRHLPPISAFLAIISLAVILLPAPFSLADAVPYYRIGLNAYVTLNGSCYHTTDNCGTTKYAYSLSLAEAGRLGYRGCSRCAEGLPALPDPLFTLPEDEPIVYLVVQDDQYHHTDNCAHIMKPKDKAITGDPVPVTLEEALYLDKEPCAHCAPPKE